MASYSSWYTTSQVSVTALAAITDSVTPGDAGTYFDKAYWEARAYDQIKAIFTELGSAPGTGSLGNWTINNNNATSDTEDSQLYFDRGSAMGGDAYIKWNNGTSSHGAFSFSHNIVGLASLTVGTSASRISKIWSQSADFSSNVTIAVSSGASMNVTGGTGAFFDTVSISGTLTVGSLDTSGFTGMTGETFTADTDDTVKTAGTGTVKFNVSRAASGDAYLGWDEATDLWMAYDGANNRQIVRKSDTDSVLSTMFASSVFAGSGGGAVPVADWGTATTAARSDHAHAAGATSSTGTTNNSFDIDSDYGGTDTVEARFGGATRYIKIQPTGTNAFEFSNTITSDTDATDDLGTSGVQWRDLRLSRTAYVGSTIVATGVISTVATSMILNNGASAASAYIKFHTNSVGPVYQWLGWNNTRTDFNFSVDGGTTYYDIARICQTSVGGGVNAGDLIIGDAGTSNNFGYAVDRGSGVNSPRLLWDETDDAWSMYHYINGSWNTEDIVGTTSQQTMTLKTLTSPTISAGTFTGSATISGTPTFSGVATFSASAVFSASPSFSHGTTPFTVSGTSAVTNLNADLVDGIHGTALLLKAGGTITGNVTFSGANLDMGGGTISNAASFVHQSSHLYNGSDPLAGYLGIGGVSGAYFLVNATSGTGTNDDYIGLGSTITDYYMKIVSTSSKLLGLGGSSVDIVPGTASANQDVGNDSRRWRNGFFSAHVNFTPGGSDPSDIDNGSIWARSGSPQALKYRLGSASYTLADGNGKTGMTGSTAGWTIPTDTAMYLDGTGGTYYLWHPTGAYSYMVSGSANCAAFANTGSVYFYQDVYLAEGKKLYLDWDSNTYLIHDSSGAGSIKVYVNGSLRSTI